MIDEIAAWQATGWGVPANVHIPIAALDEAAISNFVGDVVEVLSGPRRRRALLVTPHTAPIPDSSLPIWDHPESWILRATPQVWVEAKYTPYRKAYQRGLPEVDLAPFVISHAMNRREADLKGFSFVRVTPTSRSANSSSAFAEGWGVALHSDPVQMARNRNRGASIQYADLSTLMLMLNISIGGGVMDVVNEGQHLIRSRAVEV